MEWNELEPDDTHCGWCEAPRDSFLCTCGVEQMPKLSDLKKAVDTAKDAATVAQGGSPATTTKGKDKVVYVEASREDVAKILGAAYEAVPAWACYGSGNLQFAIELPNGSVLACFVNTAKSSAADRNLIHPAKRVPKDKKAAPDTASLLRGL